jgi:hypothetical protein
MKVFYYNSETAEEIPSERPVEMGHAEVSKMFSNLVRAESFLGILLSERRVLQIYLESGGDTHLEILDESGREALSATVNTPIAEAAIEAACSGLDVQSELGTFFLKWRKTNLPET